MNDAFISIKALNGELKRSVKKSDIGITVSTEELVLQKPHVNYHIQLEDIVSIIPYGVKEEEPYRFVYQKSNNLEVTHSSPVSSASYLFYVSKAIIHNRSGKMTTGPMQFVMPIHQEMLKEIGLDVPQVTELAHELRKEGMDIPPDLLKVEEMVEILCQ